MKVHNDSPKEKVCNLVIGSLAIKDSECDNIDMLISLKYRELYVWGFIKIETIY